MIHLGISYGHCATVAAIADGTLVFCQSEERLNRLKNSVGLPYQTLEYLYHKIGGPDRVASCTLFNHALGTTYLALMETGFAPARPHVSLDPGRVDAWAKDLAAAAAAEQATLERIRVMSADAGVIAAAQRLVKDGLRIPIERIDTLDHHRAHAMSALPFLDDIRQETLIFTLDGEGDGKCATVSLLRGGFLTRLSATPQLLSLGNLYAAVTGILGFTMLEHEYKVMGLAPYAKSDTIDRLFEALRGLLFVDDAGIWRGAFHSYAELVVRLTNLCRFERFDAIAAALQRLTETQICKWITRWVADTGVHNIACAGGVFMNVKANQRVAELPEVERMTVVPSCGDESAAIGCAVHGAMRLEPAVPLQRVRQLYLGMNFPDETVERHLRDDRVADRFEIDEPPDINHAVADLLAAGHVVARCSGPMEFGARALGNRSILANPSNPEQVAVINDSIKNRDFWMPFAPTVLAEEADALFVNPKRIASSFMMTSFDATPHGRRALAAALHSADFTLRPQILERAANPDYHDLITAFRARTGVSAVLNTSFNLHGEPIVCTPADAIATVTNSGLEYLALNRFLLAKRRAAA